MPSSPGLRNRLFARISHGLAAQGLWAVLSVGVSAASGALSFAFLAHALPKAVLGSLLVVQASVAVTSQMGRVGLDRIIMRDIHRAIDAGLQTHWARDVVGALRAALAPSLLVSGALAFATILLLTHPISQSESLLILLLVFLWCEAESIRPIAAEALRAIGKIGAGSLFGQPGRAGLTIVTTGVLFATGSTELIDAICALALPSILMTASALAVLLLCARREESIELSKRHPATYYYRHGMPLALTGLAGIAVSNGDVLLAGAFFSASEVATYGAALRIANILMLPMFASSYFLMPHISAAWSSGRPKDCEPLLRRLSLLQSLVTVALAAVILLSLDQLLLVIAGPGFEDANSLVVILMAGVLINVITGVPGDVLAYGRWSADLARIYIASTIAMMVFASVGASTSHEIAAIAIAFAVGMGLQNVALAVVTYLRTGIRTYPAFSLDRENGKAGSEAQ